MQATPGLALARLETAVGFIDHEGPAPAADNPVVPVPAFQRF